MKLVQLCQALDNETSDVSPCGAFVGGDAKVSPPDLEADRFDMLRRSGLLDPLDALSVDDVAIACLLDLLFSCWLACLPK